MDFFAGGWGQVGGGLAPGSFTSALTPAIDFPSTWTVPVSRQVEIAEVVLRAHDEGQLAVHLSRTHSQFCSTSTMATMTKAAAKQL